MKRAVTLLVVLAAACTTTLRRYELSQVRMGVEFRVVFEATSDATARRAGRAVFARLRALDEILSDWNPDSELNRITRRRGWQTVSRDLYEVLRAACRLAAKTGGAFDPTIGPLVALWRTARRTECLPAPTAIAAARARVDWRAVEVDPNRPRVRLRRPGIALDLGGIAKGYALDEAVRMFESFGIRSVLIDGGGDIRVAAPPHGRPGWTVAASGSPGRTLVLHDAAVATSGDTYQFVEIDGKRYSHIVDPRTGLGLTQRRSVTVVAATGIEADGLATAISVLGRPGLALLDSTTSAWIVDATDS